MNSKHTHNAVVFIKDVDARIGVLQWLVDAGYGFSSGKKYRGFFSERWEWCYETISLNPCIVITDQHVGLCAIDGKDDEAILNELEKINGYKSEFTQLPSNICGFNKELIKAVALLRSDRDDYQYYVEEGNPHREDHIFFSKQWEHYPEDCNISWCRQYVRKATVEDLQKYFTNQ